VLFLTKTFPLVCLDRLLAYRRLERFRQSWILVRTQKDHLIHSKINLSNQRCFAHLDRIDKSCSKSDLLFSEWFRDLCAFTWFINFVRMNKTSPIWKIYHRMDWVISLSTDKNSWLEEMP
jgi:hypothetical protein